MVKIRHSKWRETMKDSVSKELVEQIALDYLREKKKVERADIALVEEKKNGEWSVRGTTPIDLEGHPWAEKFEIIVDVKGKVKSIDFALL